MHKHLARLDQILVTEPVFYITACTDSRREELANREMHGICREVWHNAEQLYGWIVGRYVIMPDHVHFFAC